MAKTLTINIRIARIGKSYIAISSLGGFTIRGARAATEEDAVRRLLYKLSDQNDDEASIAVELATEGTTIEEAAGELASGLDDAS